jgi:hypothetical protein
MEDLAPVLSGVSWLCALFSLRDGVAPRDGMRLAGAPVVLGVIRRLLILLKNPFFAVLTIGK